MIINTIKNNIKLQNKPTLTLHQKNVQNIFNNNHLNVKTKTNYSAKKYGSFNSINELYYLNNNKENNHLYDTNKLSNIPIIKQTYFIIPQKKKLNYITNYQNYKNNKRIEIEHNFEELRHKIDKLIVSLNDINNEINNTASNFNNENAFSKHMNHFDTESKIIDFDEQTSLNNSTNKKEYYIKPISKTKYNNFQIKKFNKIMNLKNLDSKNDRKILSDRVGYIKNNNKCKNKYFFNLNDNEDKENDTDNLSELAEKLVNNLNVESLNLSDSFLHKKYSKNNSTKNLKNISKSTNTNIETKKRNLLNSAGIFSKKQGHRIAPSFTKLKLNFVKNGNNKIKLDNNNNSINNFKNILHKKTNKNHLVINFNSQKKFIYNTELDNSLKEINQIIEKEINKGKTNKKKLLNLNSNKYIYPEYNRLSKKSFYKQNKINNLKKFYNRTMNNVVIKRKNFNNNEINRRAEYLSNKDLYPEQNIENI